MADDPLISERAVGQWSQWAAEYGEKIAPAAKAAGISPDAFFLGYMVNWLRMSVDDLETTVRGFREDRESWRGEEGE